MGSIYDAMEGLERISYIIRMKMNLPDFVIRSIVDICSAIIHAIFMCELINYGDNKNKGLQQRILNPGNEYNKINGTVVFWALKSFIYLSLLGSVSMIYSYAEFTKYSSHEFAFLKWFYLFVIISNIILQIGAAWYLRKFLLEYFCTYNFSSRFLYWFLQLPVIGFIAWLVMLADSDRQETFKERERSITAFSNNSPNSIVAVFIVLLTLRLLLTLASGQWQGILAILVSAGLFAALVTSRTGYYLNLYLNLLIVTVLILVLTFGNNRRIEPIVLILPIIILNMIQLYMSYPAFHFEAFSYIAYEEEEKQWEPGQDLF